MDFLELANARYSVRSFADRKVEKEKLDRVLEAGRVAPTACNRQPQRILVIDDAEGLSKVAGCTECHFGAPVVLIVCYDKNESWVNPFTNENAGAVDAAIVTTHMTLEAADIGLGSTIVAFFDPVKTREAFAIPDGLVPALMLPLGYPSETSRPSKGGHLNKKPMEDTVRRGGF